MKNLIGFLVPQKVFLKPYLLTLLALFLFACNNEDEEPPLQNVDSEEAFFEFIGKDPTDQSKISSSFGGSWWSTNVGNPNGPAFLRNEGSTIVERKETRCSYRVLTEDDSFLYIIGTDNQTSDRCSNDIIALPIRATDIPLAAKIFDPILIKLVSWERAFTFISPKCLDGADQTPPVIDCSTDTISLAPGIALPYLWDYVSASDNCQGRSVTITQSPDPSSGILVKPGDQKITFTAKDKSGNTTSCSIMVFGDPCAATDTVSPTINCSITGTRTLDVGDQLPNYRDSFSATDNCTSDEDIILTQSPPSGTPVERGNQTITITASDKDGNISSCSLIVYGDPCPGPDTASPTINCGINETRTLITGTRLPDYRDSFSATDNCTSDEDIRYTQSPPPGNRVQDGNQTITITANDRSGNKSSCRFTVIGRCRTTKPSIVTADKFLFLSSHEVTARDTNADEYEWNVTGNGHIGIIENGRLGLIRNQNVPYKTSSSSITIYTGNGGTSFDGNTFISPRGNEVYINVRARKNGCDWSSRTFLTKFSER
ncbi:HYR domain-containing protein [Aquimarina sp. RZ0]|uniref:HYR domain-containing protein n=1 Tax=Aquimarina sp. RZ0 TaxID=2607730 RepID=UPI0011F35BD3|nr:HYR domain-containing protein [Aquimarina sp. RZ0]KAA1245800.1 HYR domain-containing protein [Aquimarina sp. RZ0]